MVKEDCGGINGPTPGSMRMGDDFCCYKHAKEYISNSRSNKKKKISKSTTFDGFNKEKEKSNE